MMHRLRVVGVLLGAIACSGGDDAKSTADTPMTDPAAAVQSASGDASMQSVKLSEADVEHFVAALEELSRLENKLQMGTDPSEATNMLEGLQNSSEALAILRKHEYDLPRFQTVLYSVAMAIGADEMSKSSTQANDQVAEVEKLKGQVPKEQYEAMLEGVKASKAMLESMQNQPEGNVELVRRYRERMEKIGK